MALRDCRPPSAGARLAGRNRKRGPAIVGGDFNTWYGFDDPVFNELATAFGTEIPDDRRPTFAGLLRLDHIFFRLPETWRATTSRLDKFGSDHHPLMATR